MQIFALLQCHCLSIFNSHQPTNQPPTQNKQKKKMAAAAAGGAGLGMALSASNTAFHFNSKLSPTNFYEAITNQGNIKQTSLLGYKDDMPIVFKSFADWAKNNPVILQEVLDMYMLQFKHPITAFFDSQESDAEYFHQKTIIFDQKTLAPMSRNHPVRMVDFKQETRTGRSVMTGLAAVFDYYHLGTPDGNAEFTLKMEIIRNGLVAFDMLVCLSTFLTSVNNYNNSPNMQFPYEHVPINMENVFAWQRRHVFSPIKNALAIYDIIDNARRMFQQRSSGNGLVASRDLKAIVMSNSNAYYLLNAVGMLDSYIESGAAYLSDRTRSTIPTNINGVALITVPFIEHKTHNRTDAMANTHIVAFGTYYKWRDPNLRIADTKDMRTRYRNVQIYNDRTDDYTLHSYISFVKACSDFRSDGTINWDEKDRFGQDSVGANEHTRLRKIGCTNSLENRQNLDWSLFYRPKAQLANSAQPYDVLKTPYRHLALFGEDPLEKTSHAKFMATVNALRDVLFRSGRLNKGLVQEITRNSAFPFRITAVRDDYTSLAANAHDVFGGILDEGSAFPASLVLKLDTPMATGLPAIANQAPYDAGVLRDAKLSSAFAPVAAVALAGVTPKTYVTRNIGAGVGLGLFTNLNIPNAWDRHLQTHGNPFETEDEPLGISRLDYHYMLSYTLDAHTGLAMRILSLMPKNIESIEFLAKHDIPIPLGGMMTRHLESQFSMSAIAIGDKTIGKRVFKGPNSLASFATNTQEARIDFQFRVGYLPTSGDSWFTLENVFPGPAIAGKGDGYLCNLDKKKTIAPSGATARISLKAKEAYAHCLPEYLEGNDWNCFMTTANSADEEMRSGIDVTGRWHRASVVGKLNSSNDFENIRDKQMYDGCAWNNHLFTFKYPDLAQADVSKLNMMQRSMCQQYNTICQPATFRLVDPISTRKRNYNSGKKDHYHILGPQVPERRAIETGLEALSRDVICI